MADETLLSVLRMILAAARGLCKDYSETAHGMRSSFATRSFYAGLADGQWLSPLKEAVRALSHRGTLDRVGCMVMFPAGQVKNLDESDHRVAAQDHQALCRHLSRLLPESCVTVESDRAE